MCDRLERMVAVHGCIHGLPAVSVVIIDRDMDRIRRLARGGIIMHNKGTLAGIGIGIVLGALLTTAAGGLANSLNLSTPPSTTFS